MTRPANTLASPKHWREVGTTEIEDFVRSSDCRRLSHAGFAQWGEWLDEDERRSVVLTAAWRALRAHRPEFGTKFTTSYVNYLRWGIAGAARARARSVARDKKRRETEQAWALARSRREP